MLFSCFQSIIYSIAVFVYGINWMEITKSSLDTVQIHLIIHVFKKLYVFVWILTSSCHLWNILALLQ